MRKYESVQLHFGAMAWATAVKLATNWGNKKIEEAFLKPLIDTEIGKEWQPPNNFTKYLKGKITPVRSGVKGGLSFVDRVEVAYPGTKYWLNLALWDFVLETDLQLNFIWEKMAECQIENLTSFFEFDCGAYPLRTPTINSLKLRCLAESDNVTEALTFLMGLLREAEIRIDIRSHYQIARTIKSLVPRLNKVPELKPFLGTLLDYIEIKFLKVIYNIPDSGVEIIYPTSWRDKYPDVSAVAKGAFPIQDHLKSPKDFSLVVNDPKSYRSLYGAPLQNPLRSIDIIHRCRKKITRTERNFVRKGSYKKDSELQDLAMGKEINQTSVIMKGAN